MTTLHFSRHSTPKYATAAVNSANDVCVRNAVYGKGDLNSHDLIIESPFNLATTLSLSALFLSVFVSLFVVIVLSRGTVENVMYFPLIQSMWFPSG